MKPPRSSDAQGVARATGSSSPLQPDDCIMGLLGVTPPEATQVDAPCEQEASPPLRVDFALPHLRDGPSVPQVARMLSKRKADPSFFWRQCLGETGAAEVSKRIELRERLEFEVLLQRCEQQKFLKQKNRKRKRQPPRDDVVGKGDRARGIAASGADSKATSDLVSSMMEMTDAEDRHWARKLIRNLGVSTGIHVPPGHDSVVGPRHGA